MNTDTVNCTQQYEELCQDSSGRQSRSILLVSAFHVEICSYPRLTARYAAIQHNAHNVLQAYEIETT